MYLFLSLLLICIGPFQKVVDRWVKPSVASRICYEMVAPTMPADDVKYIYSALPDGVILNNDGSCMLLYTQHNTTIFVDAAGRVSGKHILRGP